MLSAPSSSAITLRLALAAPGRPRPQHAHEVGDPATANRLVERLLMLRETCRLQGRRMHDYLLVAITADLHGQPILTLLTPTWHTPVHGTP